MRMIFSSFEGINSPALIQEREALADQLRGEAKERGLAWSVQTWRLAAAGLELGRQHSQAREGGSMYYTVCRRTATAKRCTTTAGW